MQKWRKHKSLCAHNDNLQDKKLENSRHFAGQQVRKSPDPSKPPETIWYGSNICTTLFRTYYNNRTIHALTELA